MTVALALSGIRKSFGATIALAGIDLEVRAGELHALLGENGAGKSTLMHVAFGMTPPDGGTLAVGGMPFRPADPRDARRAGIGMVHQHFTTVPALTGWENIALAAGWPLAGARARAGAALRARGVTLDVDRRAEELSVGLRLQLELQKALAADPRVLLLDEPTGVLTPPEVQELFRIIGAFTRGGG
ncbi:MAG TPA: ATP-binding cassette domain-containing protein, partial [Gemmatimonadales bacterium]|nr:ATP-binding cassette domain-containing protein [Gemmatimonadales bacterium]